MLEEMAKPKRMHEWEHGGKFHYKFDGLTHQTNSCVGVVVSFHGWVFWREEGLGDCWLSWKAFGFLMDWGTWILYCDVSHSHRPVQIQACSSSSSSFFNKNSSMFMLFLLLLIWLYLYNNCTVTI